MTDFVVAISVSLSINLGLNTRIFSGTIKNYIFAPLIIHLLGEMTNLFSNHTVRIVSLLFVFLIIFAGLNAQRVRVLNEATEFPIEGVNIFNKAQTITTTTDRDGYFELSIFSDTDTIYIKHISFNMELFRVKELRGLNYELFLAPNIFLMEEFNVLGNMRDNPDDLPYKVDMIKAGNIKESTAQTAAEILQSTGNIMVQKSQGGGGSPVIRGYEANKILLVIDGVRLNNAIYRNGHLQNSITIGQSMLDRIELVFGPSSIVYGSEAIGGVIHYHTKKPVLSHQKKLKFTLNTGLQYATANKGSNANIDFTIGKKHFAFLTAFQYGNFGDIKIGGNRKFTSGDTGFGYTPYYVGQNAQGQDIMMANPDPGLQLNTAYKQYDVLQKFLIAPNKKIDINLNFQYSTSSNLPRYDQLTEFKGDNLKYAEWYYGPQERLMASASVFYKYDNQFFTNLRATFAYQNIHEDRIYRKFGNEEQLNQNEQVGVYSANFDFLKLIGINRMNYGLEFTHNDVNSTAFYKNIFSGMHSIAQTRYPDGGSIMQSASAYVNYKWIIRDQYILTSGFRYSFYHLYSEFLNKPGLVQLPFNEININNGAPTGIVSFEMYPATEWKIRTVLSTGFRSPNVDDYGKIRAKSGKLTVPNNRLKPEYVYNAELGIQYQLKECVSFDISGYYNLLTNAILRTDFELNGQDSLLFDGDFYEITANSNAAKAIVNGVSIGLDANYPLSGKEQNIHFRATLNYNYGRNLTDDVPLGHITPLFGMIKLDYSGKRFSAGLLSRFQALKKIEDMSPYGEDNEDKATENGFPAWNIFNAKAAYKINDDFAVSFSVENTFDQMYRSFASGLSAPGRNFIFSIRYSFE